MKPRRIASRLMKAYRRQYSRMITDYDHLRRTATTEAERRYWTDCIGNLVRDYVRRKEEIVKTLGGDVPSARRVYRAPWYSVLHNIIGYFTAR